MMARTLHHAPMEYFQLEKLSTTKGPCDDADVGRPHRAFRTLVDTLLGKLSVGSWWYPTGGWTLVNPRTTTEISFVWTGHGCLTDMDGTAHNFGPGDVVILPKGWCGRCDIWDDVQKVCFTHEHAIVEVEKEGEVIGEDSPCIRARVTPYEQLMVSQYVNPMVGGPGAASRLLYAAGPTTVGSVMCAAGSSSKTCYDIECFHLIEGIVFLTSDKDNGTPQRCVAGDTVVLPPGWSGHHDVVEKATMLWISVEKDESSY